MQGGRWEEVCACLCVCACKALSPEGAMVGLFLLLCVCFFQHAVVVAPAQVLVSKQEFATDLRLLSQSRWPVQRQREFTLSWSGSGLCIPLIPKAGQHQGQTKGRHLLLIVRLSRKSHLCTVKMSTLCLCPPSNWLSLVFWHLHERIKVSTNYLLYV